MAWLPTFMCSQLGVKKLLFSYMSPRISPYRAFKCAAMLQITVHLNQCIFDISSKWEISKHRSCRLLGVAILDITNLLFRFLNSGKSGAAKLKIALRTFDYVVEYSSKRRVLKLTGRKVHVDCRRNNPTGGLLGLEYKISQNVTESLATKPKITERLL